jgi:hypothetical protein
MPFSLLGLTQGWIIKFIGRHQWKENINFSLGHLLHSKILTADEMLKKNWNCNPLCSLCGQQQETAEHLCLHCPFALQVWNLATSWSDGLILLPSVDASLGDWWITSLRALPKVQRRTKAAILIYIAWNLWKERNRRIFQGAFLTPQQVFHLMKEEMNLRQQAYGFPKEQGVP